MTEKFVPKINYSGIITDIQMMNDEVDYITNLIKKLPENGKMTEWGSGGSTCLWLEEIKPGQKLYTIEHSEAWFLRVGRATSNHFGEGLSDRFQMFHIPEQHGYAHGYADIKEEHPYGSKDYINPGPEVFDSDIFFIDGIARGACALSVLLQCTKDDPAIFIHDYVGREDWYEWACQFFDTEVVGNTLVRLYIK